MQHIPDSVKGRLLRLTFLTSAILFCGIVYAAVCSVIGGGLPCLFRKITGFRCPGCGVSRMCICLLKGDFAGAWSYNPAVMSLIPLGIAVASHMTVRYVRYGERTPRKWANVLIYIMIVVLVAFGVVRNII